MKSKYSILFIVLSAFILSNCGAQNKRIKENACSCDNYFKAQKRPAWVDTEGLKNGIYYSQGIAQCTGLKTIDVKESSANARGSLSRMLETQVQTEFLLIRKSNTATRSGSESGQATTSIASDSLLKNSSIYEHWIDPNSCTVYSAVKLAKSDLDKTIAETKAKEQQKYKNQSFAVHAEGEHKKLLELSLTTILSDNGVTNIFSSNTGNEQAKYKMQAKIQSIDVFAEKKLIRIKVFVSIISNTDNKVKWSVLLNGKSLSLQGFQRDYQIRQAVINAFNQEQEKIQTVLEKSAD